MADIVKNVAGEATIVAATNRYILGDASPDSASWMRIQIDLNGGTGTFDFYTRLRGAGLSWCAALAYPTSAPTTGASSVSSSNNWLIDATGLEVSVNVTASSGSPKLAFLPGRG